jgi:hypothetical protein
MTDKSNTRTVSWQGWKLQLPRRWDPVKLEGDHAQGYALFADALRPRLGLRWQSPKLTRKFDPEKSVRLAMRNEVGQLAGAEARLIDSADPEMDYPLLYTEPQPPGRDVYSVFSRASGRLLQIAYHAHRREHILAGSILPGLVDQPLDRSALWSIFDLNFIMPGGMHLQSQQLNAGDLGLTFADRYHQITVRQIAVAKLALQRLTLDQWISQQQKTRARYHRPTGEFAGLMLRIRGIDLPARVSHMRRRLRYAGLWGQHRLLTTIGVHDSARDRLILLQGSEDLILREIAGTVGAL